ncbi:MAG: STING domain-containing protein [Pseudomonadota bacterium]
MTLRPDVPFVRIFVAGPMAPGDDGHGGDFALHLGNIREALEVIKREIDQDFGGDFLRIDDPSDQLTGPIPDSVFDKIDVADVAVVDLSRVSPNVMYELALLHTLGTPTIVLAFEQTETNPEKLPFYMSQEYVATLPNFQPGTIRPALAKNIRLLLENFSDPRTRQNPISKFYGNTALVDLASSNGLATGYFANFARHVLRDTGSVLTLHEAGLKGLVVFRPESVAEVAGMENALKRKLNGTGAEMELINWNDPSQIRNLYNLKKVGRYLIDVPAPLSSLQVSHRFKRVTEILASIHGGEGAEFEREIAKLEAGMIGSFFSTLRSLAIQMPGINSRPLIFMGLDEFVDMIRGESAS